MKKIKSNTYSSFSKIRMKMLAYSTLILGIAFSSCQKTEVDEPSFDVSASRTTVNAGEVVDFKFSGNPDIITFFAGEQGSEYKYNKRTSIVGGKTTLDFSTTNAVPTTQPGGFTVLMSTDFKGINTVAGIGAVSWTDITNRVNLATGATITPSGRLDLNQFVTAEEKDKPLFIAFRYNVTGSAGQGTWVIKSFDIKNTTTERTFNLADIGTAGWIATSVTNPALNWAITNIDLTITGRISVPVAAEDWIITKPIYINRIMPDVGLTIKDTSAKMINYSYTYETPGVYQLTFVAANANRNGIKEKVKQITITVK